MRQEASPDSNSDATNSDTQGGSSGGGSQKRFSVYQMINVHDVDQDTPYEPQNPFKPLAFALILMMAIAGGSQNLMWFREQAR